MTSARKYVRPALGLAVALLLLVLAFAIPSTRLVLTLAMAKGFAVLGIVVLMRAGQVSFGHALFFAVSAYAAAFLGRAMGGGEALTMLAAGVAASLIVGLVVGFFVVRYRYIFFGMLNLAFSMILYSILDKFYIYTGGSDGIRVVRPTVLGMTMDRAGFENFLFVASIVLAIIVAYAVHRYLKSPAGNMLQAIRTNETRLEYLGVSARATLLVGYVVSAGLCGLGGVLMAFAQGIVTPEYAWWIRSGELVFVAVLGGSESVIGAFIGSLLYEAVRTYASAFAADYWQMILGFVLLAIIMFAPRGLMGLFNSLAGRLESTPAPEKEAAAKSMEPAR